MASATKDQTAKLNQNGLCVLRPELRDVEAQIIQRALLEQEAPVVFVKACSCKSCNWLLRFSIDACRWQRWKPNGAIDATAAVSVF